MMPMTTRRFWLGRRLRRSVAVLLVAAGAVLLLLSPSIGPGLVAFALGIALEAIGLVLEHRPPR